MDHIGPYAKVNQHGAELCHAYKCRKHKRLHEAHKGKWCDKHYIEIIKLREVINKHDNSSEEFTARLEEIRLRKITDDVHWKFASKLEKSVNQKN